MTEIEMKLIAALATIGLSSGPKTGQTRPAGIGTPRGSRASSHQVCDPHTCDHVTVIERLLFCALRASPDMVLFRRKGLAILHEPKLSFAEASRPEVPVERHNAPCATRTGMGRPPPSSSVVD